MGPAGSKKPAATESKGSLSRAIIGSVVTGLVLSGVVIAILIGSSNKAGDGDPASATQPVCVVGGKGGGILANTAEAKGKRADAGDRRGLPVRHLWQVRERVRLDARLDGPGR